MTIYGFKKWAFLITFSVALLNQNLKAQIISGNEVSGNLTVTGTTDIEGTTLALGTDSSNPGVQVIYTDGTSSTLTFNATRNANLWEWQQNYGGTTPQLQMSLSSGNALVLYNQGSPQVAEISLNPLGTSTFTSPVTFNGAVTMNGAINTSGNLGVGTSSPGSLVDIEGSGIGELTLGSSNSGGDAIVLNNTSTGSHDYQLYITGSSGGTIGTGKFGLYDSTNGNTPFSVYGGTSATAGQYVSTTANSVIGFSTNSSSATPPDTAISRYAPNELAVGNGTAGNSSGTVLTGVIGIGTTSPYSSAKLDVGGYITTPIAGNPYPIATFSSDVDNISGIDMRNTSSQSSAEFRFTVSDNEGDAYIAFTQPSDTSSTMLFGQVRNSISDIITNASTRHRMLAIGTVDNESFILGTYNTEVMRLTNTGNVGIGTTTPTTKLEVNGNGQVDGTLRCKPGGDLSMGSFTAGTNP